MEAAPAWRGRTFALLAVGLLIPLLPAAAPLPAPVPVLSSPWTVWHREVVDADDVAVASSFGFALGPDGTAHVAYREWLNSRATLVYARQVGAVWLPNTLEWASDYDVAVSPVDGTVHLVYEPLPGRESIRHAVLRPGASAFEIEDIAANPSPGSNLDAMEARVDAQGRLFVLWNRPTVAAHLTYRNAEDTAWVTETLPRPMSSARMALDPLGGIHVVNTETFGNGAVWYLHRSPAGAWTSERVAVACVLQAVIDVDPAGHPHIACTWNDQGVAYLHHDGVKWTFQSFDHGVPHGVEVAIAVDGRGMPHVAYRNQACYCASNIPTQWSNLYYATPAPGWRPDAPIPEGGAGWTVELVDGAGAWTGGNPEIAVDPAGIPHILHTFERFLHGDYYSGPLRSDLVYTRPVVGPAMGVLA